MKGYEVLAYSGSDPALAAYKNMLYAFFKKSLRDGNDWFRDIDDPVFHSLYTGVINSILSRPMTVVKLAVLPDERDTCLGFSVSEGNTLHYVFVKNGIAARRQGIATALVPEQIDDFTHLTKTGRVIWKKKFPHARFNPFL